jgi:hypothetical protein
MGCSDFDNSKKSSEKRGFSDLTYALISPINDAVMACFGAGEHANGVIISRPLGHFSKMKMVKAGAEEKPKRKKR